MNVFVYIMLAFALGTSTVVVIRGCAEKTRIQLTRGLAISFVVAITHCLMLALGMVVANLLNYKDSLLLDINNLVFLGLVIVVAVRMLAGVFRKNREIPAFDISRWSTVLALSVASGINVLLIGLALGFLVDFYTDAAKALIPLFVAVFFGSYMAVMFGRQKVKLRERRWMVVSVIFICIFALIGTFQK